MSDQLEAEYDRWCDAFHSGSVEVHALAQETLDLRAEVKRLKAALNKSQEAMPRQFRAHRIEDAAKVIEDVGWYETAGLIRKLAAEEQDEWLIAEVERLEAANQILGENNIHRVGEIERLEAHLDKYEKRLLEGAALLEEGKGYAAEVERLKTRTCELERVIRDYHVPKAQYSEKVLEVERLEAENNEQGTAIACCADLMNTWAREWNVEEVKRPWSGVLLRDLAERLWTAAARNQHDL